MTDFKFENKTVMFLSPEKWGKMHLSKHHYAIELANLNNVVYFTTIDFSVKKISLENTEYPNIIQVKYNPFFPYKIKFHFRKLFDFLMKFQIKSILKEINKSIDVLWCFDFNLYSNLKCFNAKEAVIFHPVDPVNKKQIKPSRTADFVFSVSEKILSSFKNIDKPKFFINHGLSSEFQKIALNNKFEKKTNSKIKVGYFGNLLRPILDTYILKKIIEDNKDVDFIFWGSYKNNQSNIGGSEDKEVVDFISFLLAQKNVYLKGPKSKSELVNDIIAEEIDMFILVYKYYAGSDRSNAHKIMEYLSTGKVVVANNISTYNNFENIIVMPNDDNDSLIPDLFKNVIANIDYYNSAEMQNRRIEFALDNTYKKQLKRIENIISDNI